MLNKKILFNFKNLIKFQRYNLNTNSNCTVDIKSLRVFGNPENNALNTIRIVGVPMRINFYDSHRSDPSIRYNQSILPTVLMLPSSQYLINDYSFMIEELSKKYRVLALVFPGCEKSKLLDDYAYYTNTPIQKTAIVHDFLNTLLPNRKKPLNFIVGFDENSHVLPTLNSETNQFYLGHNKLIMVNPAPHKYISELKASSMVNLLNKTNLTRKFLVKKVTERIKSHFENSIKEEQIFQFFESWLTIDKKTIDLQSIVLSTKMKDLEIYLNETNVYDSELNNAIRNSFEIKNGFKNFKFILENNILNIQKQIIENLFKN